MASKFDDLEIKQLINNRKSIRNAIELRAELLVSSGPRFKVSVIDLSRTGFRIETGNLMTVGTKVYLNIPGLQSLRARIAWNERLFYGCEFAHSLHESIFEHIAKQHPHLVK